MYRNPDIDFKKLIEQLESKSSLTPEMVLEGKELKQVPHKAVLKETKQEVQVLGYSDLGYYKIKVGEKIEWVEAEKIDFSKEINETEINEPPAALVSLAKKAGKSVKDAERYWRETKRQLLKDTGKKEKDLTSRDYQYIMGVVKKRLGLPTKPLKDSKVLETALDAYDEEIKVGDKVKVVEPASESGLVGKVFTVVAIEDEDGRANVFVRDEQGNEDYFWADKLEKVSEFIGKKFLCGNWKPVEIGDIVRIADPKSELQGQGLTVIDIVKGSKGHGWDVIVTDEYGKEHRIDILDVEKPEVEESKVPKFNEPVHKQMKDLLEADLIAIITDEKEAKELAQKKKGWYRKDEQSGKYKVYVGESYPDSPRIFGFLSDHWKEFIDRKDAVNNLIKKFDIDKEEAERYIQAAEDVYGKIEPVYAGIGEGAKVFEERGKGQGVGGPRQGDGGAKYCYCTRCGYYQEHPRGIPCKDIKCSSCGEYTMIGVDYLPQEKNESEIKELAYSPEKGIKAVFNRLEGKVEVLKGMMKVLRDKLTSGREEITKTDIDMINKVEDALDDLDKDLNVQRQRALAYAKNESVTEQDTRSIKVEHPGILEVPVGKKFWQLPLKHFIDLAKKKGKAAVARAINNLRRWNKNRAPDIAKKAEELMNRLKANPQWQAITATESISETDMKRYQELAEKLYVTDYLLNEKKGELTEKGQKFIDGLLSVKLSETEREIVFEKYLDLKGL